MTRLLTDDPPLMPRCAPNANYATSTGLRCQNVSMSSLSRSTVHTRSVFQSLSKRLT